MSRMSFLGAAGVAAFSTLSTAFAASPAAPAPGATPSAADAQNVVQAVFMCGQERVAARFAGSALTLWVGSQTYELEQAMSGSGARYTGNAEPGPIEFWNKGDEATLTIAGKQHPTCQAVANRPVSQSGSYQAAGTSPAWTIDIGANRIALVTGDTGRSLTAALPAAVPTAQGYRYDTQAQGHPIVVDVIASACTDAAGREYPDQVRVTLDGRVLQGCGGDLATPPSLL